MHLVKFIGPLFAGEIVSIYHDQLAALAFAGVMVTVALIILCVGRMLTVRQEVLSE